MSFFFTIASFIFYRVMFKAGFDEDLSLLADGIICLLLFITATWIGLKQSAVTFSDESRVAYMMGGSKTLRSSFGTYLAASLVFTALSCGVVYGFSDDLSDHLDWHPEEWLWVLMFLNIPLISYFFVNGAFLKRMRKDQGF